MIAVQRDRGARMLLRLRGSLPMGIRGVTYRRRIENPLPWTGYLMQEALSAAGIRVRGGVRVGRTPEGAGNLAYTIEMFLLNQGKLPFFIFAFVMISFKTTFFSYPNFGD